MLRNFIEKFLVTLFVLLVAGVLGLLGIYAAVKSDLPQLPDDLERLNLSLPTEIFSSDGQLIRVLGQRRPVPITEISPNFLNAIIAVEDSRFYLHNGIDHVALLRAFYINFKKKRIMQGGSTITQQLSKNLFFSFERNWVRKIKELLIALQMEATFSKNDILEAYSNQIYFGNGAYGVEEASQTYFRKPARDLTPLQGALLAGIPHAPNDINPFASIERAMKRTEFVVERMAESGLIKPEERETILGSPLELAEPRDRDNPNLYFIDFVLERLEKEYGKEIVYYGGIKIYVTLNAGLQEFAQKAVQSHLAYLETKMRHGPKDSQAPLQAALVSVENQTGAVRVLLGGSSYSASQFNRAVSNNRLPGSSFKPFLYLTAMEQLKYHPATVVLDEPETFKIPGTDPWEPRNFDDKYMGPVILKKGLMMSANLVSARLMYQVTPEKVIQTARRFGITSPLGAHYSLALGTSPVSPLEMATAFSVIANLGFLNEPFLIQKIEDFNGNVLYEHFFQGAQRFPQKTIYPLLHMMQGVIDDGTGRVVRRMNFTHPAAGKTGTTNDYKDSWFTGFTKDLTTSVWVGKDDNTSMIEENNRGLTGSQGAAPIWVFFMNKALEGKNKVEFPVPDGIRFVDVDIQTGQPQAHATGNTLRVAVPEEAELTPKPAPPSPVPGDSVVPEPHGPATGMASKPTSTQAPPSSPVEKAKIQPKEAVTITRPGN